MIVLEGHVIHTRLRNISLIIDTWTTMNITMQICTFFFPLEGFFNVINSENKCEKSNHV